MISWAVTNYYLHKAYPDLVGPEYAFRGLAFIFGTHPASNVSFVSGVGTRSKMIAYGNNRADFTFIAGGVVPGILVLKPDFPENKEDWPFLWGENEYVIDICAELHPPGERRQRPAEEVGGPLPEGTQQLALPVQRAEVTGEAC